MAKPINNGSGKSFNDKTWVVSVNAWDNDILSSPTYDSFTFNWTRGSNSVNAPAVLGSSNDFLYVSPSLDRLDGEDDGIYATAYSDTLTVNGGKGSDQIIFSEGGISILDGFFAGVTSFEDVKLADGAGSSIGLGAYAASTGIVSVEGGDGNDLIAFGAAYDAINVRAEGEEGNDSLITAGGNDVLRGGSGNDLLEGNGGADSFVFAHAGADNADLIVDFDSVEGDRIVLSGDTFAGLSNATLVTDFGTKLLYNTETGELSYDADGADPLPAVTVAYLDGMPVLSAADFVIA